MIIGIEFKLNNELFITEDKTKYSVSYIKSKIIEISDLNENLDDNRRYKMDNMIKYIELELNIVI